MSGDAKDVGDVIYSVEVRVIRGLTRGEAGALARLFEKPVPVRYCDTCRRWGPADTTHRCWRNWRRHLSDVLIDAVLDGKR